MKTYHDNFVNTSQHNDEKLFNENINAFQNHDEDPLDSVGTCVSETKYYKLDEVVFAEPIEDAKPINNHEESDYEDVGELTFIDNVVIKKRTGKRNQYIIDMKDGCLDCPMSSCSRRFSTAALLRAHVRRVHCAAAEYVCELCGAAFPARHLLRRHAAVHAGSRVQCARCGKWLSARTNLSVHLRTHGSARPHACASCDKRFLRLSSLNRHVQFVHRDGDIPCNVCDARFATRVQWTRHRSTHKP